MCISYKIMPLNPPVKHRTNRSGQVTGSLWRANNARVEDLRQQRETTFLAAEPGYVDELELMGQDSPWLILALRNRMQSIPRGLILKVATSTRVLAAELAAAARLLGYVTIEKRFRQQHYLYVAKQ